MPTFSKIAAVLSLTLGMATTAHSEEIARYYVELGPQDFFNSSGTRLRDGAAIFQQDRANYHRFGIRHGGDGGDPVFGSRDMRARIPSLFANGPSGAWLNDIAGYDSNSARTGYADYLVLVCGTGGNPTYMFLNFADGDAYDTC